MVHLMQSQSYLRKPKKTEGRGGGRGGGLCMASRILTCEPSRFHCKIQQKQETLTLHASDRECVKLEVTGESRYHTLYICAMTMPYNLC